LLIGDVMSRKPICIPQSATMRELAELLDGNDISGAPVVDATGRLIGVVSQTDMLHRCVEGPLGSRQDSFFSALAEGAGGGTDLDIEDLGVVEDFMSDEPVTATADEPVATVAARMAEERVHRVVVVDGEDQPIGIVTTLDLLKVFPSV
jgi:CBS domain-containing protein